MAESNSTQVILTDDGIKIIKAQDTADNAASQATDADSAALIAQSTANAAKSAADSTYDYANSEMAAQSNATAKAQSTADNAFSQAQAVGSQASAEISSNSTATATAQSTADNAFSQATTAIDNGKVTSQAVTDLKDGSTLTIAQLGNGLATKVANSDYASYKEQTASQIASKVDNGDFSTYQTQTADLIAQKVATSDFSTYQTQTASEIADRVSNSAFSAYQTQTASQIASKVDNGDFSTYKTQTAGLIDDKVSNSAYASDKTQTASEIADRVSNSAFSAYQTQTADLIASKVATSDFSAYQATTAKSIDSKVESSDFNTYQTQTADLIASKVDNGDFSTYKTQTADAINLRVTKGDLIDEINLQAGSTLISSSGQLTLSGKTIYFDTANPVIIPSANITGTLTGKELTAGTINGSVINGSTINGATINTPTLNLGLNGTLTTTYNDTQPTSYYNPKKYNGTMDIQAGVFYSSGTDSFYDKTQSAWVGIDDSMGYDTGGTNSFSSEIAPMHLKFDIYGTTNQVLKRLYMDAFGVYVMNGGGGTSPTVAITGQGINSTAMISSTMGLESDRVISNNNFYLNGGHTINSIDGGAIWFENGTSSGGTTVQLYASKFSVSTSRISTKRNIELLDDEESNRILNGTDTASFQFLQDSNADDDSEGVLIDDVNPKKQYSLPIELVQKTGKGPKDLMSFIARLISQNKYQSRLIEDLQIRMREVELANE